MRAVVAVFALLTGCAELGVVTDGTTISKGIPSRGRLIDGKRLPDKGEGFTTRDVWQKRGNRYGTDELLALVRGVSRRMRKHAKDTRLVIADLSSNSGAGAEAFHKSHKTGRDVDLLYYMRDAEGKPFEADSMRVFDGKGVARDQSGFTVDIPRTWQLAKELLTAPEADVQYIFIYRPIAEKLIEHAKSKGESDVILARAIKALKQPGDSAPHNDHMHVRIYCAREDRAYGCVDIGPLELLAEREAERANDRTKVIETIAESLPPSKSEVATAADVWAAASPASTPAAPSVLSMPDPVSASVSAPVSASFSSLFGARPNRIDFRRWR